MKPIKIEITKPIIDIYNDKGENKGKVIGQVVMPDNIFIWEDKEYSKLGYNLGLHCHKQHDFVLEHKKLKGIYYGSGKDYMRNLLIRIPKEDLCTFEFIKPYATYIQIGHALDYVLKNGGEKELERKEFKHLKERYISYKELYEEQ